MGKIEETKGKHDERDKPMSFISLVIWTGMFGGVFWICVGYVAYYLNFTDIRPTIILEPWALGDWKYGWLGAVISIIFLAILSTAVAFVYYVALRKFNTIYIGMCFGVALFICVFVILNPLFPSMDPFLKIKRDTIITSVCIYILYGVFVGYTISYQESEIQTKKLKEKKESADLSGSEG